VGNNSFWQGAEKEQLEAVITKPRCEFNGLVQIARVSGTANLK